MHFTTDDFVSGGAADQCFASEYLTTAGAFTWGFGEILSNAFDKALHQGALPAFAIFEQCSSAARTRNINGTQWLLFAWFRNNNLLFPT